MAYMTKNVLKSLQFLDLEDLDEIEKSSVLGWLDCRDSSVQLPWEKQSHQQTDSQSYVHNTTNDTQECYDNFTHIYQCPPHPQVNSQAVEYQQHYPVYPNTNYYHQYPPVTVTHSASTYVNYSQPHTPVTQQLYYPMPAVQFNVAVQFVPTSPPVAAANSYYDTASVSTSNIVANSSICSSNTANNDPSSAPPPSNNSSEGERDSVGETRVTAQQNGLPIKDDSVTHAKLQNGTGSVNQVQPVPPKVRSWASLLKSPDSCDKKVEDASSTTYNQCNGDYGQTVSEENCPIRNPSRAHFIDPVAYQLAEYLRDYNVEYRSVGLQPRGLLNKSNYCYINSILQALLACPQMYHLLQGLKNVVVKNNYKSSSTIDRMCMFIKEYSLLTDTPKPKKSERAQKKDQHVLINYGTPFEPIYIHKMFQGKTDSFQTEGRQEDAEEFLGVLLNALNDEMAELINLLQKENNSTEDILQDEDDKEWQVMGKKNKSNLTRKADFSQTPISNIFGGLLKSRIHRNGDQPTDNIQPFFTLQLNIEKVKTVREALDAIASKIQLEGVTCTKTNKEVEAWQQTTIEQLPEVLILHLKCFDYKINGCTKIIKMVEFPIDLKMETNLLSTNSKCSKDKDKQYKLFAIVYHDGKEASKGHYFTDAYHSGFGTWLRYDDAVIRPIQEEQVLKPQGNKVPYLLFYRRCSDRNK